MEYSNDTHNYVLSCMPMFTQCCRMWGQSLYEFALKNLYTLIYDFAYLYSLYYITYLKS